jgi:translation initiation factor IF-2
MSETKNPGERNQRSSKIYAAPHSEPERYASQPRLVAGRVRRPNGVVGETKPEAPPAVETKKPAGKAAAAPVAGRSAAQGETAPKPKASGVVLRTLTEEERSARAHALADSRVREAEERKIAEEEARRRASRASVDRHERKPPTPASARKKSVTSARRKPSVRPARLPRSVSARMRHAVLADQAAA